LCVYVCVCVCVCGCAHVCAYCRPQRLTKWRAKAVEMVAATAQIESRRALLWICRIYRALLRGSLSHVGLFCGYVGYVELFCEYVGLFCRAIGLFCGIEWRARAVQMGAATVQIESRRPLLRICRIYRALLRGSFVEWN